MRAILTMTRMANAFRNFLIRVVPGLFLLVFGLSGCKQPPEEAQNTTLEEVAGSPEMLDFMKTFAGRGTLSDSSMPTPALEALAAFRYPDDLAFDLVLSEPAVTQPLHLTFDHRGRLWIVQYNQYPYPKGTKVMSMDQHMRAQYDKTPQPPPDGTRGADKVSFFEDTNGDGTFDKVTDAVKGLNIATSVALGRGMIWVLAPPYLLSYPDKDNNGVPDGKPMVHLEGFGIEDTHAVANNLRWGPDGWLYGAQGSTCTANVSSSVSKNVRFSGQAIWRYHPESHIFEVFAEGGGNTFDVEIDDKGRIYSGDNGASRGRYYKQGAYHIRSLGKHGLYTNPYAFGHLSDMEHEGDNNRFTHAFIRYEEQSLPERYHGRMFAINPLQSYVQLSSFEPNGSTFRNIDETRILQTKDHWFRPVDITTGPDGAVYIADWYDSRISHVDPRDTWEKKTGRIYRLRNKEHQNSFPQFDISAYSNEELIQTLSNGNKWFRQQALVEFGNRKDISLVPRLILLLKAEVGQTALESFWAIALSGGFSDSVAVAGLRHKDPFVRMWAVRLSGDANNVSKVVGEELKVLASVESHAEVRSQLAATAKRLPGPAAMPIIRNLLVHHDDANDPDIPLQLWWALESKTTSDEKLVLAMFQDRALWKSQIVKKTILERLTQRWIMEGGDENYSACASILTLAPSPGEAKPLINGIQEGLRGRDVAGLPSDLIKALQSFESPYKNQPIALGLRQGQPQAIAKALEIIADEQTQVGIRLSYIRMFGELNQPQSVPVLLGLMESSRSSGAIKQASLEALSHYSNPEIGVRVTKAYPDILRSDPYVRDAALSLLVLRNTWAVEFLNAIDRKKKPGEKFVAHTIDKADVNEQLARQLTFLNDPAISATVNRLWPGIRPVSSTEKTKRIDDISQILKSGTGNQLAGRVIFNNRCGNCHRLFDEGAEIGPDLTGYERRNVSDLLINIIDPNAYIREGYGVYHITTKDQRSLVGTVKAQTASTISIQPFNGELVTLSMNQVSEMVEQKVSIMPEGLLNGLTDQQVRDIVTYITADK
jgi:putative heme-binding domain-containing protein